MAACGSDSDVTGNAAGAGTVVVQLTDAPFSTDSVKNVDVFVTRIDARTAAADSAAADSDVEDTSSGGWQTIATPNTTVDLLTLQHGAVTTLGSTPLTAGTYNGLRLIIDPSKSSVTLKDGTVLTNTSSPSVTFPSAAHSGLKIVLAQALTITSGATTTLLVDFDVNNSFVMRGNSITKNGLLFKPVIKATITNGASVLSMVSLVNATDTPLNLVQNGTVLANGTALPFGASSACTNVVAATPGLSVTQGTSTTPLAGFAPVLTAATNYTIVAYPTASTTGFATLSNTFTPLTGQTGFRVFNATSGSAGVDVYVTAVGAPLTGASATNVAAGAASSFVSVPAGTEQIRITNTGSSSAVLDLGGQALTAGRNMTLVIAPGAAGSTAVRAFLVTGC
jgi:hypothetical protein